jgi:hypothetical protein
MMPLRKTDMIKLHYNRNGSFNSVSDPHSLYTDLDPDPAFLTNADPDPIPNPNLGLKL